MSNILDKLDYLNETKLILQTGLVERGSVETADSSIFREYTTTGLLNIKSLFTEDPSWLELPTPSIGQNRISGVMQVIESSSNMQNYIELKIGYLGDYSLDWGDGSIISGTATIPQTTFSHTYDYDSSLVILQKNSYNTKQCVFDFIGADSSLTSFTLDKVIPIDASIDIVYAKSPLILNLHISGPNIDTLSIDNEFLSLFSFMGTNKITSFANAFMNNISLKSVQELYTGESIDFTNMFSGCVNLVNLPTHFDSSKGTSFAGMFYNCKSLIYLPELDFTEVLSMNNFASRCQLLSSIPYDINSSKCTDFSYAFRSCYILNSIKSLDVSSGIYGSHIFATASAIENLPVIINDTNPSPYKNFIELDYAFFGTTNLKAINLGNVENNISFDGAFSKSGAESIILSNTENVTNWRAYFSENLKYLSDIIITNDITPDASAIINLAYTNLVNLDLTTVNDIVLGGTLSYSEIEKLFNRLPVVTSSTITATALYLKDDINSLINSILSKHWTVVI